MPGKRRPLWRRWASRLGLAFVLAAGLAYLPYRLLDSPGVRQAPQLSNELAETREAIESLRIENERYRREIDALKNEPEAIEDIARSELGMVRPGEVVIRVDDSACTGRAATAEGAR
jgi:cell division protein FtsB